MREDAALTWVEATTPTAHRILGMAFGPTVLLATGRLGRKIATNRSDRPVFVDADGHLCCEHGERAPTLMSWFASERADPEFVRPSLCDCQNIDGLMSTHDVSASDRPSLEGTTVYELLKRAGAEARVVGTRPQRLALCMRGSELWVQPKGTLVCGHGNSRRALKRMTKDASARLKSSRAVRCQCVLSTPRRVGSVFAA
jgi:hypothetical protein